MPTEHTETAHLLGAGHQHDLCEQPNAPIANLTVRCPFTVSGAAGSIKVPDLQCNASRRGGRPSVMSELAAHHAYD